MGNQEARILERLKKGPMTKLDAMNATGVLNIGDCVMKLRRKGFEIKTEMISVRNRYGEKCRIAEYTLQSL